MAEAGVQTRGQSLLLYVGSPQLKESEHRLEKKLDRIYCKKGRARKSAQELIGILLYPRIAMSS
jgi:hypothetical protein